MLEGIPNQSLQITQDSLVAPAAATFNTNEINIQTDSDWNVTSREQVSTLGALYKTVDQAEQYYNGLYTLVSSRISESEKRVQEQDSNLRVLLSASRHIASTSIHLKGGDNTSIETSEAYYTAFGPLESVPSEGIFRLKDTGFFSSIRSLGGFAGKVEIDFSLGTLVQNGDLRYIADGSRNTFWQGTFYTPAPTKAASSAVAWLPQEYQHGLATMLTYYIDRPTLATEVFVDPVVSEPMELVSISWTPMDIESSITNGGFTTSGDWVYSGSSTFLSSAIGAGIASGGCVTAYGTGGYIYQVFPVSGNYLTTGSSTLVSYGNRCQIHYSMKGRGDVLAGARILWYDASGNVLNYRLQENFPPGFFATYRLVDYIPSAAVSGRLELGIFSTSVSASAYFDSAEVIIGEREFKANEIIDRPKTISLPEITRASRYSFVFVQRNPRREILSKESARLDLTDIKSSQYIDSSLQQAASITSKRIGNSGPGTSVFSYRLGMKELDLRYREHIPRGALVSLPLATRREIRQLWVTAEVGQFFNDNVKFYIYPFANNTELRSEIQPFGIGDIDLASSTLVREGEVLRIHTFEESEAGWINLLDKVYVTDPKTIKESFDGTTRDAKVRLEFAPHLRRVLLKNVQKWIKDHSVWASSFDPNLDTIYGLPTSLQSTIDAIRTGVASSFALDQLISREGYLPLKVTVKTDKWTAVPDVYGRPDVSKVRTVLLEELTETTLVETAVETREDYMSYDAWLAATTIETFQNQSTLNSQSGFASHNNHLLSYYLTSFDKFKLGQITLKQAYVELTTKNPTLKSVYDSYFKTAYDTLKAQGKIQKSSSSSRTTTTAVEVGDVYTTRFKPIITGPSGAFIQLYWYSSASAEYLPISRSSYEVISPELGTVRILDAPPASSYTSVLADYKYISNTEVEDHYGSVIGFATASSGSSGSVSASVGMSSKPFPITRNMTDYENGRIPILRAPNFDRLSKDYHPVIEYYVNSDGEIIFARDFFRYGDIPAAVFVEYETLAIQPRIGIEITRSGSPAATPTISNVSLRVRESSPLPLMETN